MNYKKQKFAKSRYSLNIWAKLSYAEELFNFVVICKKKEERFILCYKCPDNL